MLQQEGTNDQGNSRPQWQWEKGEWHKMCEISNHLPIYNILTGDVVNQGEKLSDILTEVQEAYIPHKIHTFEIRLRHGSSQCGGTLLMQKEGPDTFTRGNIQKRIVISAVIRAPN